MTVQIIYSNLIQIYKNDLNEGKISITINSYILLLKIEPGAKITFSLERIKNVVAYISEYNPV